jgi:hypothetical protein
MLASLRPSSNRSRSSRLDVEGLEARLLPHNCLLNFTAASFSVNESAGTATVSVVRTRENTPDITVKVSVVSGGSATAGADFVFSSGTLSWEDGKFGTKSLTIPIKNDTVHENSETIKLILSDPTNGSSIGDKGAATLTIVDNDPAPKPKPKPKPKLSIDDPKVIEGNSGFKTLVFTVKLSARQRPARITSPLRAKSSCSGRERSKRPSP